MFSFLPPSKRWSHFCAFRGRHVLYQLSIRYTKSYHRRFDVRGGNSLNRISLFKPWIYDDEYRIYHVFRVGEEPDGDYPDDPEWYSIVVKGDVYDAEDPNPIVNAPLAKPTGFECRWAAGSASDTPVSVSGKEHYPTIWRPICPAGYTALSDVGALGHISCRQPVMQPSSWSGFTETNSVHVDNTFRCVADDLVRRIELGSEVWTYCTQNDNTSGKVWTIPTGGFRFSDDCKADTRPSHEQYRIKLDPRVLYEAENEVATLINAGPIDQTFALAIKKGLHEEVTQTEEQSKQFQDDYSATIEAGYSGIAWSFGISASYGHSRSHGYSWSSTQSDAVSREQEFSINPVVPAQSVGVLKQMVIVDSPDSVSSSSVTLFAPFYVLEVKELSPEVQGVSVEMSGGGLEGVAGTIEPRDGDD